tara:strand:- start:458 stop:643 length:186 start_codon:yes stop_codon:yes gene_type:complete
MANMWWKRRKTFAMLSNRRQWQREFDPRETIDREIQLEQGDFLMIELSNIENSTFIITESS